MNKDKIETILKRHIDFDAWRGKYHVEGRVTGRRAAAEAIVQFVNESSLHTLAESPPQDGRYLVFIDGWGWDVKYWMLGKWQTHSIEKVLCWRELPPVPEVTR